METPQINSRKEFLYLVVLVLFAIIVRAWFIWMFKWNSPNGDEAVAGLMAKHIAEGKDFPVFYYGQAYFGALEAYLTALLFRLFGFRPNLILLLPFAFGVTMVVIEFYLVRRLFGSLVALASASLLALCSPFYLDGTLSAAGGFGLALLLQTVAIWLYSVFYFDHEFRRRQFLLFCGISGVLFWVWQIYIPIFAFLLLLWVIRRPPIEKAAVVAGIILFVIGSGPLWLINLEHGGATFKELTGKYLASDTGSGMLVFAKQFVGNRWWNLSAYVREWLMSVGAGNLILLGIILFGLAMLWRTKMPKINLRRIELSPAAFFLATSAIVFIIGHKSHRYLYVLPALLIPCAWIGLSRVHHRLAVGALAVAVLSNFLLLSNTKSVGPRPNYVALIEILKSREMRFGYSDYWNAYPITFLSGEQIVVAPGLGPGIGGLNGGLDRYPKYTAMVDEAPRVFILLIEGEREAKESEMLAMTIAREVTLVDQTVPGFKLYFPLRPTQLRELAKRSLKCTSS